jgi:hypothetical protein
MGFVLNVDGGRMQELDYIEVRTTEQWDKHTRGGCVSSTKRKEGRDSTKYANTRGDVVQGLYKVCTREDV